MKSIIQQCMVIGILVCAATTLFAQDSPLTMKILETNSTDDQFCFYVHANTTEQSNTIEVLADINTTDNSTEGTIVVECLNDDVCRTKICYDRPATEPVETLIQCRAISPTFSISDGCTVIIYPRSYRASEPIEVNITADCGFASACDPVNLNPSDITHLTLGVPRDDGGFDYIAYAGVYGEVQWYNENRELIHTGSWTDRPHEVAYVELNHYQPSGPVRSGIGNTMGDSGVSFRYSTYPNTGAGQNSIALTNFPNPFNEQTTIQFDISEETSTTLTLYDMSGKIITKILDNEILSQGKHEVSFNGNGLDAGVYYYTIQAGTYTGTQRMNLMR